jgi:adenylate kinase
MRRGALVPDATVSEMVREGVACLACGGGFILDGFPRTLGQAELLQELMESEGLGLTAVVNYELPTSEIAARLGGRRTCERCKAVFHLADRPPKVAGCCDHCGGKPSQREDDRPESITVRLDAYERSTAPLIDFYKAWTAGAGRGPGIARRDLRNHLDGSEIAACAAIGDLTRQPFGVIPLVPNP